MQEKYSSLQKNLQTWVKENSPQKGEDPQKWQEKFKKYLEDMQNEMTRKIDERNAALEADYQAKRQKQQNIAINLSRISPASALMFGAMSLSRTGLDENTRFLNSIKSYKPAFATWANTKMMRSLNFGSMEQPKPDLGDMPRHMFEPESLRQSLMRSLPDFVIMILLILIFYTGAFVSFLKYDVR